MSSIAYILYIAYIKQYCLYLKECDINLSAEFKHDLAKKFNGKFSYLKDKISLDALRAFYYPIVLWNQKDYFFVVIGDKFDFFFL